MISSNDLLFIQNSNKMYEYETQYKSLGQQQLRGEKNYEESYQSIFDFPDISQNKFFKLDDMHEMDIKYQEQLQLMTKNYYQNNQNEQMMDEQNQQYQNELYLTHTINSRLSINKSHNNLSFNNNNNNSSGFMFEVFNIYAKQKKQSQIQLEIIQPPLQHSRITTTSRISITQSKELNQYKFNETISVKNQIINNQIFKEVQENIKQQPSQWNKQNQKKLQFKLDFKKPQFCMGAFNSSQTNFFGWNQDDVISQSLEQYTSSVKQSYLEPFNKYQEKYSQFSQKLNLNKIIESQSHYFNQSIDHAQLEQKNRLKEQKNKQQQQFQRNLYGLSDVLPSYSKLKDQNQQNIQKAVELGLIEFDQQQEQISFIEPQQHLDQSHYEKSFIQNYEQFLLQRPNHQQLPIWQSRISTYKHQERPYTSNNSSVYQPCYGIDKQYLLSSFQVSHQWHEQQLSLMQSYFNVTQDIQYIVPDQKLFLLISQMLQGIQNNMFYLDYDNMQWYIDLKGIRFQHTLRNSLVENIQSVIQLANMKSRLEKAVEYIKMRTFRKVFAEISNQIGNTLKIFQEYVLQLVENWQYHKASTQKQGIIEFISNIEELIPQIRLLYELMISQSDIKRQGLSYFNFDHRFLRSQFELFLNILRICRQVDSTNSRLSLLIKRLLSSTFKPILLPLNRILFQQLTELNPKQEIYLRYYFQSTRELFTQLSKRMAIVHRQAPQLYVICKEKIQLKIVIGVDEVRLYEEQWTRLFLMKFNKLQNILNEMMREQNQTKNIVKRRKQHQLIELKQKAQVKALKQQSQKQAQRQKQSQQMSLLKNEIKQKEQRKKLQQQIEKEKEKAYLLELELKKKKSLAYQKQKLIQSSQNIQILKQANLYVQKNQAQQKQIKAKKWRQIKTKQMNRQVVDDEQLKIQSRQQIFLPIVNTQIKPSNQSNKHPNSLQLIDDIKQMCKIQQKQPKSPKSQRSRKIRKNTGKIRNMQKAKRQGQGKIYDRVKLNHGERNQMQIQEDMINLNEACEKSKKLNFNYSLNKQSNQERMIDQIMSDDEISSSDQSISLDSQEYEQGLLQRRQDIDSQMISHRAQIPTNCLFQICIDKIISNQSILINNCYEIIIFQKYHLKDILTFMQSIFMSQNGEALNTLLSMSVSSTTSQMSLRSFSECFLFDNLPESIVKLEPGFYKTRQQSMQQIQQRLLSSHSHVDGSYGSFNLISQNLSQFIGFQFLKLPLILEEYFSYIHLSKYMQIFEFILRIKHCEIIIEEGWKQLNQYKKELFKKERQYKKDYQALFLVKQDIQLLNQLFVTRHWIQLFLTTYQNYIFFRVIEKEYKSLNKKLEQNELYDLPAAHLKLLETIIRFAFVNNPTNEITKQIKKLMQFIRQFRNIIDVVCGDDLMQDQRQNVQIKVRFIHQTFKRNHKFFEALYFKV